MANPQSVEAIANASDNVNPQAISPVPISKQDHWAGNYVIIFLNCFNKFFVV